MLQTLKIWNIKIGDHFETDIIIHLYSVLIHVNFQMRFYKQVQTLQLRVLNCPLLLLTCIYILRVLSVEETGHTTSE